MKEEHEEEHECELSTFKNGSWIYLHDNKWYMDVATLEVFVIFYCPFCGAWLDVEPE